MPRKSRSYDKHAPAPDPKYGNVKYAKFINYMMQRGKKNVARKIFYDALEIVTEKMKSESHPAPAAAASPAPAKTAANPKKIAEEAAPAKGTEKPQQKIDGRQVFDIALKNVSPIMEIKGRRIGGSNYQVPMEVMEPRRTALGMKWLIAAAQSRKGAPMREKLALEIIDAYNKTGSAVKKREDTHRMAEANKAFAHFARFGNRRR
ncbi:MAG: 30S ribosomal protein S7 [Patescibacteria group bacterium]|nr:30S ribosomal protein S7 [Patescibacteria group bacterium]